MEAARPRPRSRVHWSANQHSRSSVCCETGLCTCRKLTLSGGCKTGHTTQLGGQGSRSLRRRRGAWRGSLRRRKAAKHGDPWPCAGMTPVGGVHAADLGGRKAEAKQFVRLLALSCMAWLLLCLPVRAPPACLACPCSAAGGTVPGPPEAVRCWARARWAATREGTMSPPCCSPASWASAGGPC